MKFFAPPNFPLQYLQAAYNIICLTIVEECLIVWVGPILHQDTLGQVSVERDLGCLGAHHAHVLAEVLVLLPVVVGQVMVGEAGVQVKAVVLDRG